MKYILALDQGTTSSRAIVFDHDGMVRSLAQKEIPPDIPATGLGRAGRPGNLVFPARRGRRGNNPGRIDLCRYRAIGITNQRETTLVWDRQTGLPIHNAIVWQDRRTAATCDRLKAEGLEGLFREKTGLVLDPYFSGTKLCLDSGQCPRSARKRGEAGELLFGTVDSWLLWNLTGGQAAQDRREQRLPDAHVQYPYRRLG